LAQGPGYTLFLTAPEAVLVLHKPSEPAGRVVRMGLLGAQSQPRLVGLEELPGKVNYLIGRDPAHWHTQVPVYAKVKYEQVYPGIDLVYYGNPQQLEYDFLLAPGANPKTITLAFQGADKLELAGGEVVLHTAQGDLHLRQPQVYQERAGVRQPLAARYVLKGPQQVGFEVAAYDPTRPLIIDPVLSYSTFLGGSGIAVDETGSAYVTGFTESTDFPTARPLQGTFGGGDGLSFDAFVAKLSPDGSTLLYSTYLGGSSDGHGGPAYYPSSGYDEGTGIAVDGAGSAYVTGYTHSADFPTALPLQGTYGGNGDVFVAKLSPDGSTLLYSTYLGGSSGEAGTGIAVDGAGSAYVTGVTDSEGFPTANPLQGTLGGRVDAFVAKILP
jgi:hypothetical protein